MIPVKLKMRNFMCYRDNVPPLEFTGIHLVCLSGDNGNGKSAIIDAITWALWGKARASSIDDLIHTTQSEMEVEFDFAIGPQIYRIIRKRSRPKKRGGAGQSSLDLMVASGDGFRVISGNTMDQTQEKIIKEILHMDYDTFINSAYLRQGHADEFTRQAPSKRKEVLGNILGLSLYDELEDRARTLARQHESTSVQLENTINEINNELSQKPAYEAELERAQGALSRIDAIVKEKEAGLNELRKKKEALESKKSQLDELEARINNSTRDLQRWEQQTNQHLSRIKTYEEVIGRRETIESGYAQFTEAKKTNDELEQKFRQSVNLDRQKTQLEKKITEAKNELLKSHALNQQRINDLEARAQNLIELRNRLNLAQSKMRQMGESESTLRQKEQAVQETQKQISYLEAEKARLEREIGEVTEKLDLLASHTGSHKEAKCPLCETELTHEGLTLIESKYTKEKQEKSDALKANRDSLAQKRAEFEALQKERSQIESGLNQEKSRVQGQISVLTRDIGEIEQDEQKLAGLRETLNDIEQRLAKRDFAIAEQQAMADIEAELTGLDYDSARHEQARQQLKQLEPYERDKNTLDEAERLINQEKEAAARAGEAAQGLRDSLKLDNEKKEALTAELTRLPALRDELATAEAEYRDLAGQRSQAQEAVGSVKAKIQRCAELEIKKKEKESQLAQVSREETIYRELARAFGKTGIQALIIETALPEIQTEANALLARMTDGRMTVKFDTQKETKKGTVQETLDITIADELGTRNYEMFSGGEAFRINFAIRIGLSRLLAKRAGAPLPTLIIDEGFGTQDNTGLEKLQEAIKSIQDDFEKILVVTHMDELKDAFPTRIDITKTAEGSMISVN
ncbi:MAG TPA: SMC family ATPase [Dehalococcoidales bacterium]|nr:SMC family ATPase [Dehalococcoidales bacterium]